MATTKCKVMGKPKRMNCKGPLTRRKKTTNEQKEVLLITPSMLYSNVMADPSEQFVPHHEHTTMWKYYIFFITIICCYCR